MNKILWIVGAAAGYLAYTLLTSKAGVSQGSLAEPVDVLAHRLEDAWADHHTVA